MILRRYGDLELGFTTNWQPMNIASNGNSLAYGEVSFFKAVPPPGWSVLGCAARRTRQEADPDGRRGGLLVRAVGGGDLLRPPVDYRMIWRGATSGATGVMWRPIPPPGYVAMGDYYNTTSNGAKPPLDAVVCVKQTHNGWNYARRAEVGDRVEGYPGGHPGSAGAFSAWPIVPPPYAHNDQEERLLLPGGMFTGIDRYDGRPAPTEACWVLDLPAQVEHGPSPSVPQLTSHTQPPRQGVTVTDRTFTVPYYMVTDPQRDEPWKVNNSPFYQILRRRNYELILYRNNSQGSIEQPASEQVQTGVSTESSEAFSRATGISVGFSYGVEASAKPFGIGVSASWEISLSASLELGYESRYAVTTMQQVTITQQLTTPPRSSAALWMERQQLLPVRSDGSMVSVQAVLPFQSRYYHTSQYPPAAQLGATARYAELDAFGLPVTDPIGIPVEPQQPGEPREPASPGQPQGSADSGASAELG
ncbi:Vps62-related protein [Kitasatospora sp. NPDC058478]|uniref:Vps62-related protein n=1 Tax=unclassified Kitasatospora TaxID=2633591 RepID=UPI0036573E62